MFAAVAAMHFIRRILLPLIALGMFGPAQAPAEEGEVLKELSAVDAERILGAMKIEYSEVKPGIYRFSLGGYKTLLFNRGKSLQFFASFKKKVPPGRINEWNASVPYTRAYLDKDGDPVLQADLNLEGGVAPGALLEFIKTWIESVKKFTRHIGFES